MSSTRVARRSSTATRTASAFDQRLRGSADRGESLRWGRHKHLQEREVSKSRVFPCEVLVPALLPSFIINPLWEPPDHGSFVACRQPGGEQRAAECDEDRPRP